MVPRTFLEAHFLSLGVMLVSGAGGDQAPKCKETRTLGYQKKTFKCGPFKSDNPYAVCPNQKEWNLESGKDMKMDHEKAEGTSNMYNLFWIEDRDIDYSNNDYIEARRLCNACCAILESKSEKSSAGTQASKNKTSEQLKPKPQRQKQVMEPVIPDDETTLMRSNIITNAAGKLECVETMTSAGLDYRGCQSRTIDGQMCSPWKDTLYEDLIRGANNYCRNIPESGTTGIFCMLFDDPTSYGFCAPRGSKAADQNVSLRLPAKKEVAPGSATEEAKKEVAPGSATEEGMSTMKNALLATAGVLVVALIGGAVWYFTREPPRKQARRARR